MGVVTVSVYKPIQYFYFFFFPPYHKSKPEVTNHPEEFPNSFRGIRFFHHCGALKVIVWIYQITAVGKKVECIVSVQRESYSKKPHQNVSRLGWFSCKYHLIIHLSFSGVNICKM